jgi:hypothetical protein
MKAVLFVLLAIGAFAANEPVKPDNTITEECVNDLINVAIAGKPVVTAIESLVKDFSLTQVKVVVDGIFQVVSAAKTAITACATSYFLSLSDQCISDIEGIAASAVGIGEDVAKIVKGDYSALNDIISRGEAMIGQIKAAKNDC